MRTMMPRRSAPAAPETPGLSGTARAEAVAWGERRDPLRRRWGRMGGGILAAVVGGWLFASLYLSAGDRSEVLVIGAGVARFETIERSDLRVVRLPDDAPVASVPASRLDAVVGRLAATDLTAGSLLAEGQLLAVGERLVTPAEAVVGVLVGPGDAPVTSVDRGQAVRVVVRPPAGTAGAVEEVSGWVAAVASSVSANGERPVEVVVPGRAAATVSAAAADRRVTIVVLGG